MGDDYCKICDLLLLLDLYFPISFFWVISLREPLCVWEQCCKKISMEKVRSSQPVVALKLKLFDYSLFDCVEILSYTVIADFQ